MADQPKSEPLAHTVSVESWINAMEIGDVLAGMFVICRGCGSAIPSYIQHALKAHVMTCEPLRRAR